jgi:DNA-binding transcriptional regulator YiaG
MTAADLRAWRHSLNLNRKAMGNLLGCSWRSIEHYEQGRRIPRGRVLLIKQLMKDPAA